MNGKALVYGVDGVQQHLRALEYYGRWLRTIIRNIFVEHSFSVPRFSFSIGYGSDIIDTLNYYAIGDPFCLLSVFVPTKYTAFLYQLLIVLRLYLSGISFSLLCLYVGKAKRGAEVGFSGVGILMGTLVYVFSGYGLYAGIRHPYFLNPMVFFPIILIGVELILAGGKPYVFIAFVAICAMSNFYFFYMIVILTVLYVVWRLFTLYSKNEIRSILRSFLKIALFSVIGTGLACVIMYPSVLSFFGSTRSQHQLNLRLFFPINVYKSSIGGFLSASTGGSYWTRRGYTAIGLISVILLFMQKGHKNIKVAFAVLCTMTLLPFVASAMNGFGYESNRWIWGYSLLMGYIVALKWRSLFSLSLKQKRVLTLCIALYFVLCFVFVKSYDAGTMFALACAVLVVAVLALTDESVSKRVTSLIVAACVLVGVVGNGINFFSPNRANYMKEYADTEAIRTAFDSQPEEQLKAVDKGALNRYTGEIKSNNTLYSGVHSTQYYWSLENGHITDFRNEMALSEDTIPQWYSGLDSRAMLCSLANVKYYYGTQNGIYGFTEPVPESKEQKSRKALFSNEYALPFGYTYDKFIDAEEYEALSPLEKQEALLQGCVIDYSRSQGEEAQLSFTGTQANCKVIAGSNVTVKNNTIRVTKRNSRIRLTFDGTPGSETYLYLTGMTYKGIKPREKYTKGKWASLPFHEKYKVFNSQIDYVEPDSTDFYVSSHNNTSEEKRITYRTPKNRYYSGRDSFLVNLGYSAQPLSQAEIRFDREGVYSFDSIQIVCQPMDKYKKQISELKKDCLENVKLNDDNAAFATNNVSGDITLKEPKYLLVTIPYSDGWSATVDGKPQKLLRANTMFMALYLESGEHHVVFSYRTPGLVAGFVISAVSYLSLCATVLYCWHRERKIKHPELWVELPHIGGQ